MSITTPHGSGATEQSSLRTIPSITTITERDLGREIDRIADEIRTYDQARGLENQDIADNVKALRDELRDLAQFLQNSPSLSSPVVVTLPPPVSEETPRRGVQLTDRPVGGSSIISSLFPPVLRAPIAYDQPQSDLSRSNSLASYLSSHHSDDYIFEEADMSIVSPEQWPTTTESELDSDDEDGDESTLESSSSPHSVQSRSIASSASDRTARPQVAQVPEFLEQSLKGIQDQLKALEDGQAATRNLIDTLGTREIPIPEDHTPELTERLNRIEELIRGLENLGHPRGPEIAPPEPSPVPTVTRAESISESSDSLDRLRGILDRLANVPEEPRMPVPLTAQAGPSVAQQLESILSPPEGLDFTGVIEPPPVIPFNFQPSEGRPIRSPSPISMRNLPPRPITAPFTRPEVVIRYERPPPRESRRPARSETRTSTPYTAAPLHTRPPVVETRDFRNVGRTPTETEPEEPIRRRVEPADHSERERIPNRGPPVMPVIVR